MLDDNATMMDFAGPWEVFQDVAMGGGSGYFLYTVAPEMRQLFFSQHETGEARTPGELDDLPAAGVGRAARGEGDRGDRPVLRPLDLDVLEPEVKAQKNGTGVEGPLGDQVPLVEGVHGAADCMGVGSQ